jgi:hypothetical protein
LTNTGNHHFEQFDGTSRYKPPASAGRIRIFSGGQTAFLQCGSVIIEQLFFEETPDLGEQKQYCSPRFGLAVNECH